MTGISSFAVPGCLWPLQGVPWRQHDDTRYQPPCRALLPSWDRGTPYRSVAVSQDGAPRNWLNAGVFGSQPRNGAADRSSVQPSLLLGCGCCRHPCRDHERLASNQGQRVTSRPQASHKQAEGTQPLGRDCGWGSRKEPGKGRGDEERDAVLALAWPGVPKRLPASLEHEWRGMWHCPQSPQCPWCPPGYCCHLLAGSNPALVLSLATAPRPGDPSVTPLSCAPLLGTQHDTMHGSGLDTPRCPSSLPAVSPRKLGPKTAQGVHPRHGGSSPRANLLPGLQISPTLTPSQCSGTPTPSSPHHHHLILCSLQAGSLLRIIPFVLVSTGTGSGPWLVAGLEQRLCWGWFLQGPSSSAAHQGCRAAEEARPEIAIFLLQPRPLGSRRDAEIC